MATVRDMSTQPMHGGLLDFGPGDRLRLVRRRLLAGTKQADLARQLGVTSQALSAWEAGRNENGITAGIARRMEVLTGTPGLAAWILGVHPNGRGGLLLRLDSNQEPPGLRHPRRSGANGRVNSAARDASRRVVTATATFAAPAA